MTQGQEDQKHQQMNEIYNLWQIFLQKIVEQCERKYMYHKILGFRQHQYSVFCQTICRKEKFVPNGSLTAWLLQRNRNAWKLQHYWKNRFTIEGQAFLHQIVTIDETWVKDFEPELKSQSNEWRSPNSPQPKKFWRAQSKIKQMIFAYDHQWIIMTDRVHVEQVWQKCIIITGYKNHTQNCTKTNRTCLRMDHSFSTTMHACIIQSRWVCRTLTYSTS
jgi:hypothetical protein